MKEFLICSKWAWWAGALAGALACLCFTLLGWGVSATGVVVIVIYLGSFVVLGCVGQYLEHKHD